ncbi:MAG: hypothetical protein KC912_17460 [Proteobacteria bacterium]|nr:hypothetical protein [Pseudomonadota bacterium]
MRVFISATPAGLARAAMLARAGEQVRVLRVGDLRGLGAAPIDHVDQLAALRALWGPLAWVPKHERRQLHTSVGAEPLGHGSRLGSLSEVPGLHAGHRGGWVRPARGWAMAERRQIERIQAAGGDVIHTTVEELEIEDGQVVGVTTATGFEWVDAIGTDVDPNAVLAWLKQPHGPVGKIAEVEVEGTSSFAWELLVPRGPVFRVSRCLSRPERVTVHLRDPVRARHQALEFLADHMVVDTVREVRIASVAWSDEAAAQRVSGFSIEVVPALI